MATTYSAGGVTLPDTHWRTRDIVIAAIIGVAFGVVFWAWGVAWGPLEGVFALAPWAIDML
jgi:energy-coupling factor transport system substrate-specific component